ncbi:hypothetical protein D3C85_1169820 [compost metagenome]
MRESEALLVALGEGANNLLLATLQSELVDGFADTQLLLSRRHIAQVGDEAQIRLYRHLWVQGWCFRQVADLAACLFRIVGHGVAVHEDLTMRWIQVTCNHAHRRCFASTIRP